MKEFFKDLVEKAFGPGRILLPTLLFCASYFAIQLLLWRIGIFPVIYVPYFILGGVISGLVGYYLFPGYTSRRALVSAGATAIFCFILYGIFLDTFVEVTWWKVLVLIFLFCVGVGGIYSVFRILINLGLR